VILEKGIMAGRLEGLREERDKRRKLKGLVGHRLLV
jgi:hypothetical protein